METCHFGTDFSAAVPKAVPSRAGREIHVCADSVRSRSLYLVSKYTPSIFYIYGRLRPDKNKNNQF